jgi:uncharacterized protein (DUF58 family)
MAPSALSREGLPNEAELQSFARAAAHLLNEQRTRTAGSRVVRRKAGIGIEHLDHRDYIAGDDVRQIDWRQTARRGHPIVRRFEDESVSDWTILLDASSSMMVRHESKWHAARRIAAGLSYALLDLGHRVRLLAFSDVVFAECPRGRGARHYAHVLSFLRSLHPARRGKQSHLGQCVGRLHGAASVLVLSDFFAEDEMRRALGGILQRCTSLHAVQVSDHGEIRLAAEGAIDVVDVETGARLSLRINPRLLTLATQEIADMTRRLRDYCGFRGIAFTQSDVTEPWRQALLRHLVQARSLC